MIMEMNDWRPFAVSGVWLYAFWGPTEDVVAVVEVDGGGSLLRAASLPAVRTKQAAPKSAPGAKAASKATRPKR